MATEDLERRIAALEEKVLELGAPALQPSFSPLAGLQVDAAGNVAYDFDGHISADGVDLTAGVGATPPADRRVRWLREADNAPIGGVMAFEGSPGPLAGARETIVYSEDEAVPGAQARITLAADATFAGFAGVVQVSAEAFNAPFSGSAVIVDQFGESDFVRVGGGKGRIAATWNAGAGTLDFTVDGVYVGSVSL